MKKRLISILLTVLMVMSLFSGMSLSAYAETTTDANTIQYQMVNGDNVFMICQRLGLNFYDCKIAIMKLNGITDGMWSSLPVGKILTLPATNADGIKIGNAALGGTTVTTGSGANVSQISAVVSDPVAYYLIPYTMSRGETVAGACNQLGINFNAYSEQIKKINGINNWTKVPAGSTLLLPSTKAPAIGTSCYAVLAHKVASGETAYSICNNLGANYGGSKKLLEAVNNTNNLNSIKAGYNFYVPVATTIVGGGAGTSSGTTTTTTTTSSGTTTPAVKTYKLSSNMAASDGTLQFYVNNKLVTSAAEGDTVTIVTEAKSGKAVKSMVAKHANGLADLLLTSNTFIMPACDVRVDVEISSGHNIEIEANYANKAAATLNGISVSAAAEGSAIIMTSTDPTYEIVDVKASYKKLLGTKVDLPITSNGFVMPNAKVHVNVTLKPVTTYDFFVKDTVNGSFYLMVNGGPVSKAAKGADVTIVYKAQEGYTVTKVEVKTHDTGKTINVFNNTFTMPAEAVDVNVEFGAKGNNIVIMPAKNGSAVAKDSSDNIIEEADTGATVKLVPMPASLAYEIDKFDVVRNSDGYKVNVDGSYKFTMPAGGVTVTPVFKGKTESKLTISPMLDGNKITTDEMSQSLDLSVFTSINGEPKTEYRKEGFQSGVFNGSQIDLSTSSADSIAFIEYVVYVDGSMDAELTNEANIHDSFEMPNKAVTVEAKFESGKIKIGPAAVTGSGTVSFKSAAGEAISACKPGDSVTIVLTPSAFYTFNFENQTLPEDLQVIRKDTGAKMPLTANDMGDGTYTYTFNMPADGVDILAVFRKATYKITMSCFDDNGNDLTGTGLWQIQVGSEAAIVDNEISYHDAEYGDKVVASMTEAGKSAYDMVSFKINGVDYTAGYKNYAYNFAITGDRAKDSNIAIVATVRLKDSGLFNLNKSINDTKRGNVNFLITASPSGYSVVDGNYDTKAYSGDTVAIIPSSVASGYAIDAEHISIKLKDGGIVHPTPVTIDGKTAYEFVMPSNGYSSLSVNFYPIESNLKIHVMKGTDDITNLGLVYVVHDSVTHSSVLNEDAVGKVPYKSKVEVYTTEMARAAGWKCDSFSVDKPSGVTYTAISNGYRFEMPAEDTEITIKLTGGTVPTKPNLISPLPTKTEVSNLPITFYSDAGMSTIITELNSGTKAYVALNSALEAGYKLKDGFYLEDQDSNKITVNGDGSFQTPITATSLKAYGEKVPCEYKLQVNFANLPDGATVEVAGVTLSESGKTLDTGLKFDTEITVKASTGKIASVTAGGVDFTKVSDTEFKGKPGVTSDGETVTMTVNFEQTYSLVVAIADLPAGAKVTVNGTEVADGDEVKGLYKDDAITVETDTGTFDTVTVDGTALTKASGWKKATGTMPVPGSGNSANLQINFNVVYQVHVTVVDRPTGGTVTLNGVTIDTDDKIISLTLKDGDDVKAESAGGAEMGGLASTAFSDAPGLLPPHATSITRTFGKSLVSGTSFDVTITLHS